MFIIFQLIIMNSVIIIQIIMMTIEINNSNLINLKGLFSHSFQTGRPLSVWRMLELVASAASINLYFRKKYKEKHDQFQSLSVNFKAHSVLYRFLIPSVDLFVCPSIIIVCFFRLEEVDSFIYIVLSCWLHSWLRRLQLYLCTILVALFKKSIPLYGTVGKDNVQLYL